MDASESSDCAGIGGNSDVLSLITDSLLFPAASSLSWGILTIEVLQLWYAGHVVKSGRSPVFAMNEIIGKRNGIYLAYRPDLLSADDLLR